MTQNIKSPIQKGTKHLQSPLSLSEDPSLCF